MRFIKKIIFWGIIAGAAYGILGYHFVMIGNSIKILEKSRLTLDYTIFSTQSKSNKAILAIDDLREDGIGELLIEAGKMTREDLDRWLEFYAGKDEDS